VAQSERRRQSEVLRATSSPFFDGLFFPAPTGPPSGVYAYAPSTVLADGLAFEVAAGIEAGGGGPVDLLAAIGGTLTVPVQESTAPATGRPGAAESTLDYAPGPLPPGGALLEQIWNFYLNLVAPLY